MDAALPSSRLSSRWLWWLPRIAFLCFVAAVVALLWLSRQADREEQRATMISDMLWLEQDLRFQMSRNEELLAQLGPHLLNTGGTFELHARTLLGNGTGLTHVLWADPSGAVRRAVPSIGSGHLVGESEGAVPSPSLVRLVKSLGKPGYSAHYPIVQGDWQVEVHVPVFAAGQVAGVAIGFYSLRRVMESQVPWWLAERYRIAVTDNGGNEVASRSLIRPLAAEISYSVAFDPPGHGLLLTAIPYQAPPPIINRLLSAALVLLAITVLGSLWGLRRHVQGRLAAEQALRQEHAFRQAMERSLQTGLRARDLQGKIIYVNQAFCRMVGWSADELIGKSPPMPYWVDAEIEGTRALHDAILAGDGPVEGFEIRFRRRDGSVFTALIHEAPLVDADGRRTGWMSSVIDISDRKAADETARIQQERLEATARLVAVGEMASTLAHELNQPLAAVSSYSTAALNLLKAGTPAGEVQPALERAVEQSRRAGQIVRRIYGLVKRSEGVMETVDLAQCLDGALAVLDAGLRKAGIQLRRDEKFRALVTGDPVLLEQALFNLLRNAAESMREVPPDQRLLEIRLDREDGYGRIRIADHGAGISPGEVARLFEPLYTTKPDGMGMGLPITRSIIENHRGRIWYEPNPAGGSVFLVLLPEAVRP